MGAFLTDNNNDNASNIQHFNSKSSRNAPSKTPEERRRAGLKVIESLNKLREQAQANGLTEEIAEEIMNEYYEEKRLEREKDQNK